jgi:ribA/ribD-fused uncharacterized protein
MATNNNYIFFYGGIYSQWYSSEFTSSGITYANCEQYMMYKKALLFEDYVAAKKIINCTNPKIIKALGRSVKNFNSDMWDIVKFKIVKRANFLKFSQNEELKKQLLATKNKIIVEASPYDKIWGIGMSVEQAQKTTEDKWNGLNLLGKAIMDARDKLK